MYKALIVDDEMMIRNGIHKVIPWQALGVEEVYEAGSGEQALDIIANEKPDILITDINMNGMNGLDLIEATRKVQPDTKVFVLTGYDDFNYAQRSLRLNVVDFFLKPMDEEVLALAIGDAVASMKQTSSEQKKKNRANLGQSLRNQLALEQLMRKMIIGERPKGYRQQLEEEFLYQTDKDMMLVIVEPNLKMNDPDLEYQILSIKNICVDFFDSKDKGITFTDEEHRLILALFIEQEDESSEALEALSGILKEEYDSRVKIIGGSVVHGFGDIAISYNDALLLQRNEKEIIKNVVHNHRIEKRQKLFEDVFTEIKHHMISHMGYDERMLQILETLRRATDAYNLSINQVRRCYFDTASELYYAYIAQTGNEVDDQLMKLLEVLNVSNREVAYDATKQFLHYLFHDDHSKQDRLIGEAKKYISENLSGELSVALLAEALYVTPNYLSRLFKKVTGIGCNEYIIMQRIRKAKALLETTSVQTGSIAEYVGYRDTNYFSLAFKKHTGYSPTAYREMSRHR